MDKKALRKAYKAKREALTESQIEDFSIAIANRALALPIWKATYYHIFLSISEKKEVLTEFLLHILQGRDKSIVIPKAHFETGEMEHYLLQENTSIAISNYGIPEPVSGIPILPSQMEVVFVPLLAFDEKGNRIGYGKGFYDRFLAQCPDTCLTIGISFFEAEDSIPHDSNDVSLDYCVTPNKTYSFR
ncbi:5-formyltetrahydrofolate cyclo-ligase [Aureisphaera galaxeae]|uniref:5-formyltetrahydrofolate cyclo-ligase n=1 Tax=Aureisphaera galaxeae TaxID=1538023 RepID=UPI002350407D|nr:5-formyltetrahydrofolate cyclo-ligase [Aureisphaera galaxeae]MDC8002547.1 5-formyltetrahydrofolate cyclo-ligase [Aureisphaera galaxeae]